MYVVPADIISHGEYHCSTAEATTECRLNVAVRHDVKHVMFSFYSRVSRRREHCSQPCALLSFWATVCKTVRPMLPVTVVLSVLSCLSVCLSVLSVCDVGVLWPNGWMDQDKTWHACRSASSGPGHIVLDGDPAPLSQRGTAPPMFGQCPL